MIALKIFAIAFFATIVAADEKPVAEIVTEVNNVDPTGFNFEFKTSDGTSRKEEGSLIQVEDRVGIAIKGAYSYIGPDGVEYQVTFTADDKGYKPQIRIAPSQQ